MRKHTIRKKVIKRTVKQEVSVKEVVGLVLGSAVLLTLATFIVVFVATVVR